VALEAGDHRAAVAVSLIAELYVVEANARHCGDSLEALHQRRQQYSRGRMDQLHRVIAGLRDEVVPKSPLGKALTYAVNQWATLTVFLDDPRVPLANTHVERQQRRTAIGRKAYLFAGSDAAARRLAILQSMVVLCELAKAPLFEYLRDILAKLAADWPQSRIAELLPAAWMDQRRKQPQGQLPPVAAIKSTPAAS
jgi:transposase